MGADWRQQEECEMRLWAQLYGPAVVAGRNDGQKPGKAESVNINNVFESKYLKASDLNGKKIKLTVSDVSTDTFENNGKQETKLILSFAGKKKGMVLNKTNAMSLAGAWGPETDGWEGKECAVFPAKVPFQGQMVDALRIEPVLAMADDDDAPPF